MSQDTRRWVHISFSWPTGADPKQFEKVFDKAKDWVKYSRNCWLVYTGLSLDLWSKRISELPGMNNQNIFVLEVNDPRDATGLLQEWMWEKLYEYEEDD
jgi:hypothetical protein